MSFITPISRSIFIHKESLRKAETIIHQSCLTLRLSIINKTYITPALPFLTWIANIAIPKPIMDNKLLKIPKGGRQSCLILRRFFSPNHIHPNSSEVGTDHCTKKPSRDQIQHYSACPHKKVALSSYET